MTTTTKWALGIGLVVLVLIAVFLPSRGQTASPPETADLSAARAEARLSPCPIREEKLPGFSQVETSCSADGSKVDLGSVLAGRVTLINLWAPWCQPCTKELPVLDAYARQPGAVDVLTVQVASGWEDGLALLTKLGVHLPSVYDGSGQSGPIREKLTAPASLPASYLVRPDGTFRLIEDPRTFDSVAQVQAAVAAL